MGILTIDTQKTIKLVGLISTENEVDGVIIDVITMITDGGFEIDKGTIRRINLYFDDKEVVI